MTFSGPSPAGATSGALANKPLIEKMTMSNPRPAGECTAQAREHRLYTCPTTQGPKEGTAQGRERSSRNSAAHQNGGKCLPLDKRTRTRATKECTAQGRECNSRKTDAKPHCEKVRRVGTPTIFAPKLSTTQGRHERLRSALRRVVSVNVNR